MYPSHDCPLYTSGVQISISAPEPDPQDQDIERGNHQPGDQAGGDAGSMTASRESLARYHGSDSGIGIASTNILSQVPHTSVFKRPGRKRRHADETFDHEISAFFPANLDFLALQEVFDHGATTRLQHQLHRYFPYVLSDVGRYGWKSCCSSFKFLNSGLMLASRYPILDARYECYPNGRGEDALAAKGALFAKVSLHCYIVFTIVSYFRITAYPVDPGLKIAETTFLQLACFPRNCITFPRKEVVCQPTFICQSIFVSKMTGWYSERILRNFLEMLTTAMAQDMKSLMWILEGFWTLILQRA